MKIAELILGTLYPRRCPFCRKILIVDSDCICNECLNSLPFTNDAFETNVPGCEICLSPLFYENTVRESLLRYKFSGINAYCRGYAELISKYINKSGVKYDIITWVPLSRKKLRKRGYDQSKLIAESLSEISGVNCVQLIKKTKNNTTQSTLNDPEERRRNVKGVYSAFTDCNLSGKIILVVDDIVTTGATLSEAALVLKEMGAEAVAAATVANKRD